MTSKRSQPVDKEKLVEDLHHAVQAFVEGNGGKLSVIGPIEIVPHKALVMLRTCLTDDGRRSAVSARVIKTNYATGIKPARRDEINLWQALRSKGRQSKAWLAIKPDLDAAGATALLTRG